MIDTWIQEFTVKCLEYPDMPIESVFNRYMHLLTVQQQEELNPYFLLLLKKQGKVPGFIRSRKSKI